jgi:CHASE2 domain-containing sensor protein
MLPNQQPLTTTHRQRPPQTTEIIAVTTVLLTRDATHFQPVRYLACDGLPQSVPDDHSRRGYS